MRLILYIIVLFFATFGFSASSFADGVVQPKHLSATKIKAMAVSATSLATYKLSMDYKDEQGLTLVKFAHHFYPKYRPLLLLRAKLKHGLTIEKPPEEKRVHDTDFVKLLKKMVTLVSGKNASRARHLAAVWYSMIRVFEPENEDALVMLMRFEDVDMETDLDKLIQKSFWEITEVKYDPQDSRYVISNIEKSLLIPSDTPWTDTWVKVQAGKVIKIKASRMWGFGDGPYPCVGGNGYVDFNNIDVKGSYQSATSRRRREAKRVIFSKIKFKGQHKPNLGSLIAKIGNEVYAVGEEATFIAENSGILYFGPYEWNDYSDNAGQLLVTFTISD